jgi:hypothetical protein
VLASPVLASPVLASPVLASRDEPGLIGQHDRLDPVAQSQLAQDPGHVGLHRRLAQRQRRGQLGVAQPPRDQAEHLELPRREHGQTLVIVSRREPLHQAAGDGRGEQRVAPADQPDRGDQVLGGDVLEQEAAGPGGQRRVDVLVQVERGEDDDPHFGLLPVSPLRGQDPPGRLEPVHLGHPDIHQHDVRPVLQRGRDRLPAVRGLGHHRDARGAQDQPEAAPDQRLVIRDDHPRRRIAGRAVRAHTDSSGMMARTRQPPPGRGPASSSPPYRPSRSRSPISPRPASRDPPDPGGP